MASPMALVRVRRAWRSGRSTGSLPAVRPGPGPGSRMTMISRDDGDGQGDAEDRAPVGAHGGDRAVEDLADAERAQRDDAGLGRGRGAAPAAAPGYRRRTGAAAPAAGSGCRRVRASGPPSLGRRGRGAPAPGLAVGAVGSGRGGGPVGADHWPGGGCSLDHCELGPASGPAAPAGLRGSRCRGGRRARWAGRAGLCPSDGADPGEAQPGVSFIVAPSRCPSAGAAAGLAAIVPWGGRPGDRPR